MELNLVGKMIEKWWTDISHKFPECNLSSSVIMPNHIHGIITINNPVVGADRCVCPKHPNASDRCVCQNFVPVNHPENELLGIKGEHIGSPLHKIIQWVKTMTTNEYIKEVKFGNFPPFNKRVWQRNYYEHIIRNESEYYWTDQYIENNPRCWSEENSQ
jgi:REP element-mobilizing transposase RayT